MTDPLLQLPKDSKLAVLGSPIAHSKSPVIHAAAYRELGFDWEYGRQELQAEELQEFLASLGQEWRGLSLTMPLKVEAHRLANVVDPVAQESGVVNTLLRVTGIGEHSAWAGFNTDVGGLATAMCREGLDATRTLVLGAGATAVSAILAARRLGATDITVFARRPEAAKVLVDRFDGTSEPGGEPVHVSTAHLFSDLSPGNRLSERARYAASTLIISTLPGRSIDWNQVVPVALAPTFDVAYDPWPSMLAGLTEASGVPVYSGAGMLVEQAILQIRIFVNGDPSLVLDREAEVRESMYRAAGL